MGRTTTISLPHYKIAGEAALYIRSVVAGLKKDELSLHSLSKRFAVSETVLIRAFRRRHGISVHAFILRERIELTKKLLCDTDLPVKAIAYQMGYSELSNFSRDFSRAVGMSPNAYRAGIHVATTMAAVES